MLMRNVQDREEGREQLITLQFCAGMLPALLASGEVTAKLRLAR